MPDKKFDVQTLFNIQGQTAVITGGSGHFGRARALALAQAGTHVVILGRHAQTAQTVAETIQTEGGSALGLACDVLSRASLEHALEQVTHTFGPVDMLINAAGGNSPSATTSTEQSLFDLDVEAANHVFGLNFTGTFQSCQVFGRGMAERGQGCIVNVTSMSALRPLTRVPAYGAAKAAVINFTQWLATYMAQEYSPRIRVNALAPGFFLTEQNRYLMVDAQNGVLTPRGQTIIDHTPMGRLGAPEDLLGTLLWLVSPASAFVTGTVIPIDGGFSVFSGV
ncbi:MAG TPA: SDR family oxidoreductase [Ktedonobacteraceae bacterium]|nr:SDR family oxidoreductase [Ktedonobacteraceae bacterium]